MTRLWQFPTVGEQTIHSKCYQHFRGVDFSADASAVSDSRSPDALNIISDSGGFPEKRLGWRVLRNNQNVTFEIESPVNGLFYFNENTFVAHGGTKLYLWNKTRKPQVLCDANNIPYKVNNVKSKAFSYGNKLYILTGNEYLVFNGSELHPVCEDAFIPTTTMAADAGCKGIAFQAANLLTPKRCNSFVADGVSTDYKLDCQNVAEIISIKVNGNIISNYTLKAAQGIVSFATSPVQAEVLGIPNLFIVFKATVAAKEGYADANVAKISRCSIAEYYYNRIFFAGNPDFPNIDYACELNDPAYIPESSYTAVGSDKTAITGYLKVGDSMAIVKEESMVDATIYLRTAKMGSSDIEFHVAQGVSGIGAVSGTSFANLVDDPLFLGRNGVYAIATPAVNMQRTVQKRSSLIDARLTKEANLQNAAVGIWNGYYLLCVNDHAYIADSRQKTDYNNITGTFEYEWYYWDNIPARVFLEDKGELYFGTGDGELCMLNSDMKTVAGEWLMQAFADSYRVGDAKNKTVPINAFWMTPLDDDGSFMTYKTMPRAGGGIYLKTYTRSGVDIFVITDEDFGVKIKEISAGVLDFSDVDFEHFTFNTLPQNTVSFNFRKRRYKTVQLKIQNNELNQGFGFYGIERKYTVGNLAK